VRPAVRIGVFTLLLFGVCGTWIVRLALPAELRSHAALWILPTGACAAALKLSVLGYAGVPFEVSLGVVLVGSAVATAVVLGRTAGRPGPRPDGRSVACALAVAVAVAAVALLPMLRAGWPTVYGNGNDAHLQVATADFLLEHHPLGTAPEEAADQVPLVWRSKPPIYYVLGASSKLSGRYATWETLVPLSALLVGLAATGFFLLSRQLLGAGIAGGAAAMALVGLDQAVLHTALHPYYNQLWGFVTLPFAIVLAWWAVRSRTRGTAALLALFLAVGAFAYPLMLPIPLAALAVFLWPERRRLRTLRPGRRSLLWLVPLAIAFAVPARGVIEKAASAALVVLNPTRSLEQWGGDVFHFIPEHEFFALPGPLALVLLGPLLAAAIVWELRRQPRTLAWGLGAVLLFGLLAAAWFRPRDSGWYFHFKVLAFVGPLAVVVAAVAASRLRRWLAPLALAALIALAVPGALEETDTVDQLNPAILETAAIKRIVPPSASVRLDVPPDGMQLWLGYVLHERRLCSAEPLTGTSYPHVQFSFAADYALHDREALRHRRPPDARPGPPLWAGKRYELYRLKPSKLPQNCSQRMVQTVTRVTL
jgi:hypothetical protein